MKISVWEMCEKWVFALPAEFMIRLCFIIQLSSILQTIDEWYLQVVAFNFALATYIATYPHTHTIESLSAGIICTVIMLLVLSNRLFNHMLQWAWDTLKTSGQRQVPEIISCNSFENDCVCVSKYLSSWKVRRELELEVQSKKPNPLEMVKERVIQTGRLKERHMRSAGSQKEPLCILRWWKVWLVHYYCPFTFLIRVK